MNPSRGATWKLFGVIFVGCLLLNFGIAVVNQRVRYTHAPKGATTQEEYWHEQTDNARVENQVLRNVAMGMPLVLIGTAMMTLGIRRRVLDVRAMGGLGAR